MEVRDIFDALRRENCIVISLHPHAYVDCGGLRLLNENWALLYGPAIKTVQEYERGDHALITYNTGLLHLPSGTLICFDEPMVE